MDGALANLFRAATEHVRHPRNKHGLAGRFGTLFYRIQVPAADAISK